MCRSLLPYPFAKNHGAQTNGLLWMTERDNDKVQAAFKTLRDALGGQNALHQGIEAAIGAGHEADHPPGADWWAGKK